MVVLKIEKLPVSIMVSDMPLNQNVSFFFYTRIPLYSMKLTPSFLSQIQSRYLNPENLLKTRTFLHITSNKCLNYTTLIQIYLWRLIYDALLSLYNDQSGLEDNCWFCLFVVITISQISKNMPKDIERRKRKSAAEREAMYASKKSKIEVCCLF